MGISVFLIPDRSISEQIGKKIIEPVAKSRYFNFIWNIELVKCYIPIKFYKIIVTQPGYFSQLIDK